ncbi:MAG: ABC transporter permease [Clostridiales bacterium]|nr:ABC transporter permease [Clostridiales bacterium]
MRSLFNGTFPLVQFILRRDRVRLPLWVLGLSFFMAGMVPVFQNLLITGEGYSVFAMMMENPAMVALVGPVYGASNFHTGAAYANMMLVFCVIFVALMNIFLITRHTRADEEVGRVELIRSLPVGRLANLSAAMLTAILANLAMALLTGLGLYLLRGSGMDLPGSMLFGASLFTTGLVFSGFTALACQLTANSRTAMGISLGILMLMYMLRAMGDIGAEALSLLSPIGLITRTQVFVNNYFWPVLVLLGEALLLGLYALWLAHRRDVGQGLIPAKPGKRHAAGSLSTPLGLAFRLMRTTALVWGYALFILAGTYASVFGEMEGFINNNAMLKVIFAANPDFGVTEQFIALLNAVMVMLALIPILTTLNRVVSEERAGHAEHLLGRAVSRVEQLSAYAFIALLMSLVYPLLISLGFYGVGTLVYPKTPSLPVFLLSAFTYLPAIWVFMALVMALTAFLPRRAPLGFVYLGYTFFSIYLGRIANLPEWTRKLTPMGYIPQYPIEDFTVLPLILLCVIAAVLALAAFVGYRNRDLLAQ